jgi:hypothetical protein
VISRGAVTLNWKRSWSAQPYDAQTTTRFRVGFSRFGDTNLYKEYYISSIYLRSHPKEVYIRDIINWLGQDNKRAAVKLEYSSIEMGEMLRCFQTACSRNSRWSIETGLYTKLFHLQFLRRSKIPPGPAESHCNNIHSMHQIAGCSNRTGDQTAKTAQYCSSIQNACTIFITLNGEAAIFANGDLFRIGIIYTVAHIAGDGAMAKRSLTFHAFYRGENYSDKEIQKAQKAQKSH